ncbi:MAG TPA: SDR family NAD(P)-dependent oxidoreductase [Solirubrobacteraceae bacterium]
MRDGLGRYGAVAAFGGGSDIAQATLRALVAEGTRSVVLAVRDPARHEAAADALRAAGARVAVVRFDADEPATHAAAVEAAARALGALTPPAAGEEASRALSDAAAAEEAPRAVTDAAAVEDAARAAGGDIDLALVTFGVLGEQARAERDPAAAAALMRTNAAGGAALLVALGERMRAQGHGAIAVFSSVAAERPRRANFAYGASKAGLDAFAQGMHDALAADGIHVLVVRPGFVRTKMTAGLDPAPFATDADAVARATLDGLRAGRHTVWAPGTLRWVFTVLRHLPRPVWARLRG